jgi:hypothetical protein
MHVKSLTLSLFRAEIWSRQHPEMVPWGGSRRHDPEAIVFQIMHSYIAGSVLQVSHSEAPSHQPLIMSLESRHVLGKPGFVGMSRP